MTTSLVYNLTLLPRSGVAPILIGHQTGGSHYPLSVYCRGYNYFTCSIMLRDVFLVVSCGWSYLSCNMTQYVYV